MARVCWTDKAEESVIALGRHIIEQTQSRQRGLDGISRIEEKCQHYARFPFAGTKREDIGSGLRCFPSDNFLVIYRSIDDGIAIIHVAHGHQVSGRSSSGSSAAGRHELPFATHSGPDRSAGLLGRALLKPVTVAGKLGDDAKAYQEKSVKLAIEESKR